jgi:hypothetical protein
MMRPGTKLTDRERLTRLLQYGELTLSQRTVFRGWYDDLTRGALPELPARSRLWVESIYEEQGVGAIRAAARMKVRAKEQAKKESLSFAEMPLPKKPPGK